MPVDNGAEAAQLVPYGVEVKTDSAGRKEFSVMDATTWMENVDAIPMEEQGKSDTLDVVERTDHMLRYIGVLRHPSTADVPVPELRRRAEKFNQTLVSDLTQSKDLVGDMTRKPNEDQNQIAEKVMRRQVVKAVFSVMDRTPGMSFRAALDIVEQELRTKREQVIINKIGYIVTRDNIFGDPDDRGDELVRLECARHGVLSTTVTPEMMDKAVGGLATDPPPDGYIPFRQERLQLLVGRGMKLRRFSGKPESSSDQEFQIAASIIKKYNPNIGVEQAERIPDTVRTLGAKSIPLSQRIAPELKVPNQTIEQFERANQDPEHIKYYGRVIVFSDNHGLSRNAILGRIRESCGESSVVEERDGEVYVDGERVEILGVGDMLDTEKHVALPGMITSEEQYLEALSNPAHPKHGRALLVQRDPDLLMKYKKHWAKVGEYNERENFEFWKSRIGKGNQAYGNHELELMAGILDPESNDVLFLWLSQENGGDNAYEALSGKSPKEIARQALLQSGVPPEEIPGNPLEKTRYIINGKKYDCTRLMGEVLRREFLSSQGGKEATDLLQRNFKLYNVVNGVLTLHAGIPVDSEGNLIPPEANDFDTSKYPGTQEFYTRIKGKVGLELYDEIEKIVREGGDVGKFALVFLAHGSGEKASPVWMRDNFHTAMTSHGEKILGQLNAQMKKKGGPKITHILIGHDPKERGRQWGKYLLGADDMRGSAVRIDLVQQEVSKGSPIKKLISAVHNFAQTGVISGQLSLA